MTKAPPQWAVEAATELRNTGCLFYGTGPSLQAVAAIIARHADALDRIIQDQAAEIGRLRRCALTGEQLSQLADFVLKYGDIDRNPVVLTALILRNKADAAREETRCAWTYDDDSELWDTCCGHKFQFTTDGPKENGTNFCQYCGRAVAVKENGTNFCQYCGRAVAVMEESDHAESRNPD